jgi:hypothetical protein
MYGLDDGVTAYFGSHRNAGGERFGLQIYGSEGVIEILTGHLPPVYLLPDANWSPGRSNKRWLPVSSAGVDQARTADRPRPARRQPAGLPRSDRRDRRGPVSRMQRLRSAHDRRHDRRRLRIPPPTRASTLPPKDPSKPAPIHPSVSSVTCSRSPPVLYRWKPGLATTRTPHSPPPFHLSLCSRSPPVLYRWEPGLATTPHAPFTLPFHLSPAHAPHRSCTGGSPVWQLPRTPHSPFRFISHLLTLPTGPVPVEARFGNYPARPTLTSHFSPLTSHLLQDADATICRGRRQDCLVHNWCSRNHSPMTWRRMAR